MSSYHSFLGNRHSKRLDKKKTSEFWKEIISSTCKHHQPSVPLVFASYWGFALPCKGPPCLSNLLVYTVCFLTSLSSWRHKGSWLGSKCRWIRERKNMQTEFPLLQRDNRLSRTCSMLSYYRQGEKRQLSTVAWSMLCYRTIYGRIHVFSQTVTGIT